MKKVTVAVLSMAVLFGCSNEDVKPSKEVAKVETKAEEKKEPVKAKEPEKVKTEVDLLKEKQLQKRKERAMAYVANIKHAGIQNSTREMYEASLNNWATEDLAKEIHVGDDFEKMQHEKQKDKEGHSIFELLYLPFYDSMTELENGDKKYIYLNGFDSMEVVTDSNNIVKSSVWLKDANKQ